MLKAKGDGDPRLPFPTRTVEVGGGEAVDEYVIPDDKRAEVLESLYPFTPVPSLDDVCFDLHAGRNFSVRDFRVTREHGMNFLVSPYYFESGGTVIDWMPADPQN